MTHTMDMDNVTMELVDGLKIRLIESDRRLGIPILMTAPWPESLFAFDFVWAEIASLGSVTAIDLPGFGMSQGRADLMSPSAMSKFLVKIMDALKLEKAHVIAPDVGTLAALFAASEFPERFESIIGGSGGTKMELLGEPLRQIASSSRADFDGSDGGDQVYQLISSTAKAPLSEFTLRDYKRSSSGQRWNEAADFVRAYETDLPKLESLLGDITVPTLIISGKDDPFVPPANGDFLRKSMPRCRAEVLDAGHFVWEDAAQEYASLVIAWINGDYSKV